MNLMFLMYLVSKETLTGRHWWKKNSVKFFPSISRSINKLLNSYLIILIKHLQIIKFEVSLIRNENDLNKAASMNSKRLQQQYSKQIRLQLIQSYWAEFNGLYTTKELKSEPSELNTKKHAMARDIIHCAARFVNNWFW